MYPVVVQFLKVINWEEGEEELEEERESIVYRVGLVNFTNK